MSIKIYNGVRFVSSDLLEIHHQIMGLRTEISAFATKAMNIYFAEKMTSLVDEAAIRGERIKCPLSDILAEMWDRQAEMKRTNQRDPAVDFDFSISLLPFEGRVYGMPFSEHHEWISHFAEQPWVEEFAYWNNTDCPETVSEAEWDERERIWKGIFAQGGGIPSACGFSAEFPHPGLFPERSEVMALVPSMEKRLYRRAVDRVTYRRLVALKAQKGIAEDSKDYPRSLISQACHYAIGDDAQAERDAEIDVLRPMLPEIDEAYFDQ